jgi:hypothetical protein
MPSAAKLTFARSRKLSRNSRARKGMSRRAALATMGWTGWAAMNVLAVNRKL